MLDGQANSISLPGHSADTTTRAKICLCAKMTLVAR